MLGVCVCVWYKCACALLLEAQVDLPYAQIWSLRLPTHHAGEDSNSRHISCEDLEAASLTIMDSAKVRRQEQDKNVQFPQIQAATVLAKAGQLAFAPATVRSDTARPVAVGPVGEHLHNRLQSRPQSASVHKRKGWHALQHGGPQQPSPTTKAGNTKSAVYVRPDHSVNATIPLGSSPSFPSLGGVADALPSHTTDTAVSEPEPNKQSSWSSPRPKHDDPQARNAHSAAGGGVKYSAALSPGKPQHRDSKLSKGLAMSDSELAAITSLLSIHPWAEPGLTRAVLAAVNHNIAAADLLLREMEQHQAPSGSDSDEESANHIISPETSATEPAGEQQALKRSGQHQPPPTTSKAPAPPTTSASSKTCNKQSVDEGSADEDLYYKHRKEALKLSKAWRKKLHQAANAFAGSHYSGGEALANEAHQVRLKALAAHAEAAQRIEHDNNAGRGLSQFELDLHGLHAVEAVEALDRRLLCLGQLQHHSQASKLRVIVGRGNNSSGGEASLPRVVESHLLQRNMNYILGQGVITVYLRGLRH
ncbi:TPA: hypothetical protein ACH3X2_011694 [Trebouxia sp. C0005]